MDKETKPSTIEELLDILHDYSMDTKVWFELTILEYDDQPAITYSKKPDESS